MCFDPSGAPGGEQLPDATEQRQVSEALAELNCDVNHWLVLTSPTTSAEAMDLLGNISAGVLLSTCDHDGIVSSYRLLKGLSDKLTLRPSLSLALLDAKDETEANRVAGKLGGVCSQFLSWNIENGGTVGKSARVAEHLVLNAHLGRANHCRCRIHRPKPRRRSERTSRSRQPRRKKQWTKACASSWRIW